MFSDVTESRFKTSLILHKIWNNKHVLIFIQAAVKSYVQATIFSHAKKELKARKKAINIKKVNFDFCHKIKEKQTDVIVTPP